MEDRASERAERMVANYAARLRAGQMGARRDGLTEVQKKRYAASMEIVNIERRMAGQVLDTAGVATIVRPFYYSFTLRLGKLCREGWSDHSRRQEAMLLVATWESRGLTRAVLYDIALNVFNLDLAHEGKPETRSANDE
ncbi:MAG TPA: hypothetical protein VMH22_07210 [bacterium]|nr:hypothetical protein [bacterium]